MTEQLTFKIFKSEYLKVRDRDEWKVSRVMLMNFILLTTWIGLDLHRCSRNRELDGVGKKGKLGAPRSHQLRGMGKESSDGREGNGIALKDRSHRVKLTGTWANDS